jgi:SAM-dependent methyltransferase
MIKTITHKDIEYPVFQSEGNASRFAIPFALQVCKGIGVDIGCMKKEWSFPGSIPIDAEFDDDYDAFNLDIPSVDSSFDYIFSSHCLEHIPNWVDAMDYWYRKLKNGGVLFLYLPHYDQAYWRPWNNRKHYHCFTPGILKDYMIDRGYKNIFNSERDLNHSFIIMGEK